MDYSVALQLLKATGKLPQYYEAYSSGRMPLNRMYFYRSGPSQNSSTMKTLLSLSKRSLSLTMLVLWHICIALISVFRRVRYFDDRASF
ncbi:unnamed protein product [Sphagnum jensenii]